MRALQITKEGLEHLAGKLNHIVVAGPTDEEGSPGASLDTKGSATPTGGVPTLKSTPESPPQALQDMRSLNTWETPTHTRVSTPSQEVPLISQEAQDLYNLCPISNPTPIGKSHLAPLHTHTQNLKRDPAPILKQP